jgi:hypothetical protein
LPYNLIKHSLFKVKWDTKELALRQSAWVDQAVARFSEFHVALEQMQNFLPPQLRPLLMRATILHLIEVTYVLSVMRVF